MNKFYSCILIFSVLFHTKIVFAGGEGSGSGGSRPTPFSIETSSIKISVKGK